MRVVIADDSADFREILQAVLASARGQFVVVGEARTGDEAIALVTEQKPDALLLDLAMPTAGGLQIIPAIRECSPQTRVIILSGFDQRQVDGDPSGRADAYVVKGRPIAELLGLLRKLGQAA
jgi:YesN/AraC family two-component response regulator